MEKGPKIISVQIALMLLIVGGCARAYNEYSGPPRPESQIAVITPSQDVKIHALNGKLIDVKSESSYDWLGYYNRLQVLPGEYTLTLIPQGIDTVKTYTRLMVRVEAGKRYRVGSQFYPGTSETRGYYKFWVDNEKTGAVVSPIVESRNPFQPRE